MYCYMFVIFVVCPYHFGGDGDSLSAPWSKRMRTASKWRRCDATIRGVTPLVLLRFTSSLQKKRICSARGYGLWALGSGLWALDSGL